MILSGYGIDIDLLEGWEGRMFMLDPDPPGLIFPIVHAGNFALSPDRSSYGDITVLRMKGRGVFFALVEYDSGMLGRGGFAKTGLALPIKRSDLSTMALNTPAPDLIGYQDQFSREGRPFSLQLVLGTKDDTTRNLADANRVLSSLSILPAG